MLDVEGTVAPISQVYEQLFPHARRHLRSYLQEHAREPAVAADLALLLDENVAERGSDAPNFVSPERVDAAADYLLWLMDQDRKSTALKSLQGKVWKLGFESGELIGTVFPDVPNALARWSRDARVAIYSSGSVEAQQLFFRYSSAGDLTPQIFAYFDTRVGPKREAQSYRAIATALEVEPEEILFFSDVVAELDGARAAKCQTCLSIRPGNPPVSAPAGHQQITSLLQIG